MTACWNRSMLGDQRPLIGDDTPGMVAFLGEEASGLVAMGYGACSCFPDRDRRRNPRRRGSIGDAGIFTRGDARARSTRLLPIAALIFTFQGIS